MKYTRFILALGATTGLFAQAAMAHDDIELVMKEAMKGTNSLHAKVATGKGTPEDAKKLLAYYEKLPKSSPPIGEAASWNDKTGTLLQAAKDVAEGKPGATKALQEAGNCKACHSVHRKS